MQSASRILRLGTRGSLLARTQSQHVADQIEKINPDVKVEVVICNTTGDRVTNRPLLDIGGKGLFTKEIEQALLNGSIDFAVHSYKDVPVTEPLVDMTRLVVAAVPKREDPRDVLVSGRAKTLAELRAEATVATGSLRRKCQLLTARPDLKVKHLRGNIDTRLKKLETEKFDAVVLAAAGLMRVGLFDKTTMTMLEPAEMLPAAAQGALAVQCRRGDARTREILASLDDADTHLCVDLERSIIAALGGDCHSPIAVLATIEGETVSLRAAVGARDGTPPLIIAHAIVPRGSSQIAVEHVLQSLEDRGAVRLLKTQQPFGVAQIN